MYRITRLLQTRVSLMCGVSVVCVCVCCVCCVCTCVCLWGCGDLWQCCLGLVMGVLSQGRPTEASSQGDPDTVPPQSASPWTWGREIMIGWWNRPNITKTKHYLSIRRTNSVFKSFDIETNKWCSLTFCLLVYQCVCVYIYIYMRT